MSLPPAKEWIPTFLGLVGVVVVILGVAFLTGEAKAEFAGAKANVEALEKDFQEMARDIQNQVNDYDDRLARIETKIDLMLEKR